MMVRQASFLPDDDGYPLWLRERELFDADPDEDDEQLSAAELRRLQRAALRGRHRPADTDLSSRPLSNERLGASPRQV